MNNHTTIDEAQHIAEKGYKVVDLVSLFMKNRWENSLSEIKPRTNFKVRDESLIGLWQRTFCWLKSLKKLNSDSDFQAIATASRALLEIYVDMIFLHFDKTNNNADKLFWFYKSEKLKAVELKVDFEKKNNLQVDPVFLDFLAEEKTEIENNRRRIWNVTKHPNIKRWTGNDLKRDCKEADKFQLLDIERFLGNTLLHFYETKYRFTNWDIHSGISAIYGYKSQKFSLKNFFYYWDCSNFGILCTKLIFTDLEFNKVIPNFEEEFERLIQKQTEIIS